MKKRVSLLKYYRAVPGILQYQFISKIAFGLLMMGLKKFGGFLLWNVGRPAFTSGDLPYLLRSWQGWFLIVLGYLILCLYTAFDINATILLSDRILKGEKVKALKLITEALEMTRYFFNPWGIFLILYFSLLGPLTGAAFGISLTSSFVIPDFIMSVIRADPVLNIGYMILVIFLFILGLHYIFAFHFILLEGKKTREAMKKSTKLARKNWLKILGAMLWFVVKSWGLVAMEAVICIVLFFLVKANTSSPALAIGLSVITGILVLIMLMTAGVVLQYQLMELTILFNEYSGREVEYRTPEKRKGVFFWVKTAAVVACISLVVAVLASFQGDLTAKNQNMKMIAHRAGGVLGPENTTDGLKLASGHGAYAGEIDVQRTKDGNYVVNHDDTFKRSCGVDKKVSDMTLDEIRELKVKNPADPHKEGKVATYAEMLDEAKADHIRLYVELKGKTADQQMADDLYEITKEHGMSDQCTFISLDYPLVSYIETSYPEMETGYLCYFSFGDIADMNCDELLLEEETATSDNIAKIHQAGKKVGVWTVETVNGMNDMMWAQADYIITDEVELGEKVINGNY